jgi:outer membrane protein TolC
LEPKIAVSRATVARAAAVLREQQAAQRPTVQATVPASFGTQRDDDQTSRTVSTNAKVDLQYTWLDGGARTERINQRTRELQASERDLALQTQDIVSEFVTLWADVLDATAERDAARSSVAAAKASLATAQARLQSGNGTRVDVLTAQSTLAQAERDQFVAQGTANQRLRTLFQRLQIPPDSTGGPDRTDEAELIRRWVSAAEMAGTDVAADHPQLIAQRDRVAAAEAAHRATKADGGPSVVLSGQVGPSWSCTNITGAYANTYRLSSEVGVLLVIPLSDGGARQARAGQALAQLDGERAQLQSTLRQLQEALEQQQSSWENARVDAQSTQVALRAAQLAESAQRARFEVGLGTLSELLTVQNDVASRQKQAANAQHQLLRTVAQLARARGVLSSASFIDSNLPANRSSQTP